jgi:chromosome segregation ATPase
MSTETKHTKEPAPALSNDTTLGIELYHAAQQRISSLEAQLVLANESHTELQHSLNKSERTLDEYKRMYDASEAQNKEMREALQAIKDGKDNPEGVDKTLNGGG